MFKKAFKKMKSYYFSLLLFLLAHVINLNCDSNVTKNSSKSNKNNNSNKINNFVDNDQLIFSIKKHNHNQLIFQSPIFPNRIKRTSHNIENLHINNKSKNVVKNNNNIKTSKHNDNVNYLNKDKGLVRGECRLKPVEITLHMENCGYFKVNTTACSGLCKSEEQLIPNTNLKKRSCSACRPTRYSLAKYNVKCNNNHFMTYELVAISECKCFKYLTDSIVGINELNKNENI